MTEDLAYFSRDEAARVLELTTRTLDRWRLIGYGPPYTLVGRQVRYRREAIETWLRAQEFRAA